MPILPLTYVRTRMRQASDEVHTFRFQQHSVVLLPGLPWPPLVQDKLCCFALTKASLLLPNVQT